MKKVTVKPKKVKKIKVKTNVRAGGPRWV